MLLIHPKLVWNISLSLDFVHDCMFGTNRASGNEAGAISGWLAENYTNNIAENVSSIVTIIIIIIQD